VATDAFAALVVIEALIKPLAIAFGRWLLARDALRGAIHSGLAISRPMNPAF